MPPAPPSSPVLPGRGHGPTKERGERQDSTSRGSSLDGLSFGPELGHCATGEGKDYFGQWKSKEEWVEDVQEPEGMDLDSE